MNVDTRPPHSREACHASATQLNTLLHVLANQNRLHLLWLLTEREASVSELGCLSGIVQPTLSQQLSILRRSGAVTTRREGKRVFYRVSTASELVTMADTVRSLFLDVPIRKGTLKPL